MQQWSNDDKQQLIELYPQMSIAEVSKIIGRSHSSVHGMALERKK